MSETIFEQARRLHELRERRHQLAAQYKKALIAAAENPDDAQAQRKRTVLAEEYMAAYGAASKLRRLAADHPGYFRDGWRESPDNVPKPKTEDERLVELRERAKTASDADDKRKADALAAKIETRRKTAAELKERKAERKRATEAAKQVTPANPQK